MSAAAKYREVERALRTDLEQGTWAEGERLPSEHELSRRFGVSYMTTRQAVSQLVADGLVQRLTGKGTFVLKQPDWLDSEPKALSPMALIVPELWQRIDPHYFPDVLQGFQTYLEDQGREALIIDYATAERSDRLPQGAAVACLLTTVEEAKLAERLKDRGFHVLAVNRYTGRRAIPWISPANEDGVQQAVELLISQGHQSIAFLRGNEGNLDALDRQKGYRKTMKKHGFHTTEAGNGFKEENGYRAALELLTTPNRPTALVCASDLAALGVMKAARELNISIPNELSLIGFGNFSLIAYLDPALSTVNLPRTELGRRAAQGLIAMAAGEKVSSGWIPTHLVPGSTHTPRL